MITVTDSAAIKLKELLKQEGDIGMSLRVAVRPGGCSGFSYEMYFDSEQTIEDSVIDHMGITVTIDQASVRPSL